MERWRRIVLEASKQSRRTTIPEVSDPIPLKQALDQERSPHRILLSETEQALTLTSALEDSNRQSDTGATSEQPSPNSPITHALAVGPEGGWTPEEMSLFTQHNWLSVTLGPRILRAETAAIAAIAIASTHLG